MFTKKILSQIFVKISSPSGDPSKLSSTKARYSSAFLLGFSFMIFSSCSTTKSIPVETIRKNTVYLSNIQYDSIYINRSSDTDRTRDTITIRKTMTEYRYKLLRDTIRIVQRDSIPYEVRTIEVKQVKYIPPWCKWLTAMGGIAILILAITFYQKLKSFV